MPTMYCALCRRPVEARRHIGAGSVLLAFATMGFSVLAIPFYSKRCSICKSTAVTQTPIESQGTPPPTAGALSRAAALEERLNHAVGELDAVNAELERVRTERDFYRQLLGDRALQPPETER